MSDRCKLCGSYALNLARHGIDQGDLCDVHYWQGRAEKAEQVLQDIAYSARTKGGIKEMARNAVAKERT